MAVLTNTMMQGTAAISDEETYQIEKSLRFDNPDEATLSKHLGKINKRKFTYSVWFKKSFKGQDINLIGNLDTTSWNTGWALFVSADDQFSFYNDATDVNAINIKRQSARKLRDCSAWYHAVVIVDTNNASADDRCKIYLNGEQITSFGDSTDPAQYLEVNHGDADQPYQIGYQYEHTDGMIADPIFLDGLALDPTAFGKQDSTGNWIPKNPYDADGDFILPAPNDGTTWSSGLAKDDASDTMTNAAKAFNGNLGDTVGGLFGGWTFTPPSPIKNVHSLRFHSGSFDTTGTVKFNGTVINPVQNFGSTITRWYTVPIDRLQDADFTFTSISWNRQPGAGSNNNDYLYAVEVNGQILIDGLKNPELRKNKNDGTNWTKTVVRTGSVSEADIDAAFDGSLDTVMVWGADNDTFTFKPGWTDLTSIRIFFHEIGSSSAVFKLNNVDYTSSVISNGAAAWWTAPNTVTTIDSTNGIYFNRIANNDEFRIKAIEIDGHILIDEVEDNSFHLKFNDTTANRNLGYSQVMNKCTGAQPMYGPGADDSAKANLKLAIPGYDLADHSHTIKGSGSAQTLTNTNTSLSQAYRKFYDKALSFQDNAKLITAVSTDYELGTSDFTFECWINGISNTGTDSWISCTDGEDTYSGIPFLYNASNDANPIVGCYFSSNGSSWDIVAEDFGPQPCGIWTHFAVVRNGNTFKGYRNGVEKFSVTSSASIYQQHNQICIGYGQAGNYAKGYMQDIRYYKGTAKYTSEFTPPVRNDFSPSNLTHDDGTSESTLLSAATGGLPIYNTSGDYGGTKINTYRDDFKPDGTTSVESSIVLAIAGDAITDEHDEVKGSGSAKGITNNSSNVTVVDDAGIYYGKALQFGSSNHFLNVSAGAGSDFDWGTGNHTMECWLYSEAVNSSSAHFFSMWEGGGTLAMYCSDDATQKLRYTLKGTTGGEVSIQSPTYPLKEWFHFAAVRDGNTMRLFINGEQKGTATFTATCAVCGNFTIGRMSDNSAAWWNGKMAGIRVYKGVAKYGAAGFDIFKNNVDPAKLDVLSDSPTNYTDASGGIHGNYATWNDVQAHSDITLSQAGLALQSTGASWKYTKATLGMKTGKWYCEIGPNLKKDDSNWATPSVTPINHSTTKDSFSTSGHSLYHHNGNKYINGSASGYGTALSDTAIIGIAFDADTRKIWYSYNGTWQASGDPGAGSNEAGTLNLVDEGIYAFTLGTHGALNAPVPVNFGARAFKYTVPTGFKGLCTQSFDNTFSGAELNNPSKYFDIITYTGTGAASQPQRGLDFSPDMVWSKERNGTGWHWVCDRTRTLTDGSAGGSETQHMVYPNSSNAASEGTEGFLSFDDGGFTVGLGGGVGQDGEKMVSWCWDAGTAAATPSTEGSITPSAQWVNNTAGFSITKYEGTEAAATVGHGLSVAPELVIVKNLNVGSSNWVVWHKDMAATEQLYLNGNDAVVTGQTNTWNSAKPTNTVFSLNASWWSNDNGEDHVAYCWTSIPGYSSFGKYSGNNNSNGPFIYTGFRPKYFMVKLMDAANGNWWVWDSERMPTNPVEIPLYPNTTAAENSSGTGDHDILSNGFKFRDTGGAYNNTQEYLYCAFAEHPFKTARAR